MKNVINLKGYFKYTIKYFVGKKIQKDDAFFNRSLIDFNFAIFIPLAQQTLKSFIY